MTVYSFKDGTNLYVLDRTLKEIIGYDDEESRRAYDSTSLLIRTTLFSVIPDRKRYAERLLRKNWGATNLVLKSVREDGIINSFIGFTGAEGPYILVERYDENEPVEEAPPSQQEMKDWEDV